ncbi:MAG TPA: VWA domain-containing protein [Terriglobales bacterium]|jgi:VWFA-related protein|nr:VWA domain-containing protein [Terriglobales bacterium]
MHRFNIAVLLLIVAGSFFSSRPLYGGEPGKTPELKRRPAAQLPPERNWLPTTVKVNTRMVVLDVVATDKKGHPVMDFKAGDFTLLEDGKEQKISIFQLQQPAPPLVTKAQPPQLEANVFTNALQLQPMGPRNVIVLDAWRSAPENQSFARSQIIKFVKHMPVDEPTAIFEFGNRGIRMLQDFTTDRALLLAAAKNIKPELSLAQVGTRQWGMSGYSYFSSAPYRANIAAVDERQALQDFATTLSAYPGRKNLIWISDALMTTSYPGGSLGMSPFLGGSLVLSDFDFTESQNGAKTKKTAQAMVDSQVAVYPVDPRGVPGVPSPFKAEQCGSPLSAALGFGDPQPGFLGSACVDTSYQLDGPALFRDGPYLRALYRQMDDLAARTGGKAYYSRNDVAKAISDGVTDGSTYYVLGYYPDNKYWTGAFRRIEVRVNRPDVKLRHRPGYVALDPGAYAAKPVAMQNTDLHRALLLSTPVETMLTIYARVTPPSSQTQNKVAVQYGIDPHGIDFQHGDDGLEHASIDCVLQAFTEKGEVVSASSNTYLASLKPESFKQVSDNGFPCIQKLDLPPGKYLLKLAARDNNTGAMGTVNARVTVPKLPAKAPDVKP